ncbi:patatin-like phospholipase family protein [Segnochrobactrum spirostomi]|uniref:patatin-like phospholipase family protein n=1 Tax=Segnochrobactrum spirostomi TaxID=2608987 RepID=UPI0028AFDFE7|nr:patatin-like phospholipase family protein [Segnochrobactrum spirostomi]
MRATLDRQCRASRPAKRTYGLTDYQKDRHKKLAHVALHTTAAPSYYPGVEDDGYIMIDGGIWANNPVMNALVDALACFDIAREGVRILSLGTGGVHVFRR